MAFSDLSHFQRGYLPFTVTKPALADTNIILIQDTELQGREVSCPGTRGELMVELEAESRLPEPLLCASPAHGGWCLYPHLRHHGVVCCHHGCLFLWLV